MISRSKIKNGVAVMELAISNARLASEIQIGAPPL